MFCQPLALQPHQASFALDIRDLSLSVALEPYGAVANLKEELFYTVYAVKKEVDSFLTERPDIRYAVEPVAVRGDEPSFLAAVMKTSNALNVGPMPGLTGAFADLALEFLVTQGRDIVVSCGSALALSCTRETQLLLSQAGSQNDLAVAIPPKKIGVAFSDSILVVAKTSALAGVAVQSGTGELTAGGNPSDVIEALKPHVGIRGGIIECNEKLGFWGGVVPLPLSEVHSK